MKKISYLLNIIGLLLIAYCSWSLFSSHSEGEQLKTEISEVNTKIAETKIAVNEAQKGQVDKLAREKRKNVELQENAEILGDEIDDLVRKRDEMKVILEENQKKFDSLSSELQKIKVGLVGVSKEVETSQKNIAKLTNSIPILQGSIAPLQDQIVEERNRKQTLEDKILTYDQETNFLKNHYNLTISALQKDFYERPWLERGERVSVTFSNVDLSSGLLMLPIGKDHGLEASMRFSVRNQGNVICQIRIKEVAYDHCVAMIVPLFGNPVELKEAKKLDLIHL